MAQSNFWHVISFRIGGCQSICCITPQHYTTMMAVGKLHRSLYIMKTDQHIHCGILTNQLLYSSHVSVFSDSDKTETWPIYFGLGLYYMVYPVTLMTEAYTFEL